MELNNQSMMCAGDSKVHNSTLTPGDKAQCFQFVEKKGDLFLCSELESLAHCISADIRMGKGIATLFKEKFRGINELKSQGKKPGGCAVLKRDSRYIYYLITKERYFHKPTYPTLESSLRAMKKHAQKHGVQNISMPRIGCGLDRLQWENVSTIIKDVFVDTNFVITIYTI